MLPFIVINGKSSKNVNGLIIQTLPPISKPAIRTEIEEIDGRDGDVVTTLGYAAYDRPILVGLRGDYNVDEIIDYFNSSGNVVFSNEPDKVYKFAIYDQIDLERLIRFRQGTVNLHVQPFKTSADEQPILWTNTGQETIANISVRNTGNIYSKPTITIVGSGAIDIYVNNSQVLAINLGSTTKTIIIDVVGMNATDPNGTYLNRQVTGDYNNLIIPIGINNVRVTGTLTSVKIADYSRWI